MHNDQDAGGVAELSLLGGAEGGLGHIWLLRIQWHSRSMEDPRHGGSRRLERSNHGGGHGLGSASRSVRVEVRVHSRPGGEE